MPRDFPHLLDSKNLPDSLKSRVHGLFSWKYFLFKISNLCVREIIDWAGTFVFKHCFKKSDVFHIVNHCVLHGNCDILQNLIHFLLWLIADDFGILRTLSGINWGQFLYFRTIPLKMKNNPMRAGIRTKFFLHTVQNALSTSPPLHYRIFWFQT